MLEPAVSVVFPTPIDVRDYCGSAIPALSALLLAIDAEGYVFSLQGQDGSLLLGAVFGCPSSAPSLERATDEISAEISH